VRRLTPLLLVIAGLVAGLQPWGQTGPRPRSPLVTPEQTQAERALTLLDVWSQTLVPTVLLQQAGARAHQVGDFAEAARLERQVRTGLMRIERFETEAARDPVLRNGNRHAVRALRASAAAWARWASLLLNPRGAGTPDRVRRTADLEGNAVRLHQAAYVAVDAYFRAALLNR
jgi:hypothetical protein